MGFFFTFQPMNTPLLKDVKLVVTDMDGTLLNPNHEVSTQFIDQFWALKKKGSQWWLLVGDNTIVLLKN